MDKRLQEEYDNLRHFLKHKYNQDLEESIEDMKVTKYRLIHSFMYFLISLKIWEEKLSIHPEISEKSVIHFKENVSNIIHAFLLTMLHLKVPAIVMMRRTQENLLTFFYYNEHHIESFRKEEDPNYRPFKDFSGLKSYIKGYPFKNKYQVDHQKLTVLLAEMMDGWTRQYGRLSNYVHGSNTNYFSKNSLLDSMTMSNNDYGQMEGEISTLSSIFNGLMIIFFFEEYISFDENKEKYFIRRGINNKFHFKEKLIKIFHEI